ncbi:MAG: NAD(P)H-dependent glycerol-3-phosphate dehydrogenase [Bacteroidales bacterium]|nr:NAD(P)H-dependent glycerol-3-phosphate dehydrogenase [Bacteroidales bacterium]MBR4679067.1 NAD(P)H-dependent glycerol-3-phosphate dehydrogenase [Bacteroidales bacterium]
MMCGQHRIGVVGGGSWATALISVLTNNVKEGNKINWYLRKKEHIDYAIKHGQNPKYLNSLILDTNKLEFYNDLTSIIQNSDILVFAVPSAFIESTMQQYDGTLENHVVVSAIKGMIPDKNIIMADFFRDKYNVNLDKNFCVLAGPCHAEEVALQRLSYLTIASKDLNTAEDIANCLECRYLKTSITDDIYGTEYAAVLKNVFAIAAGVCSGLGYGDNFLAVLMSNAIREMKRFVDTVHPINRDIKSSAYLGDLLVTAYSKFSRNRTLGVMLGQGYSLQSALLEMKMVAEGFYGSKCIYEVNQKYNIELPICTAVYNILHKGNPVGFEIKLLIDKIR